MRQRLTAPLTGRLTLAAEDLIRMALDRNHFEPLAVFAPNQTDQLMTGGDVDTVLRTTMGSAGD